MSGVHSSLLLAPCQQQLSHFLQSFLEAACEHAKDTGHLNFHHYGGVEHVNDTGDRLTQRRDVENEPVTIPALAAGPAAARQKVDDLRETGLNATSGLCAAELMWNANDDGRGHGN